MPRHLTILLIATAAIGGVEAASWWWMNPASTGQGAPVLTYRPPPVPLTTDESTPPPDSPAAPTQLPEVYRQAAPVLRCTAGQVFQIVLDEDARASLFGGWFEWDGTDAGSVLEAFRHPPEVCMGAVGMKIVSREPVITHRIGDQTLIFTHTILREPGASKNPLLPSPPVHAFRSVWVAGMDTASTRDAIDDRSLENPRTIRIRSALTRHRPPHARVVQGTVRGLHTTEDAWLAFEQSILKHLTLETRAP